MAQKFRSDCQTCPLAAGALRDLQAVLADKKDQFEAAGLRAESDLAENITDEFDDILNSL